MTQSGNIYTAGNEYTAVIEIITKLCLFSENTEMTLPMGL
jgi:hypothetical protein